ncbi:prolyl oligopeptidase family serine peptidase [Flavobacterium sp. Sd200]|uniref:prolyl oligopeptidase family serine peptidase n=1 Tax=Flavobacterium sp. Sd200 TaxID=2692211 RepID=UPI001370CEDE|nr:prolyl oligopeptidase family serine peptidase [Flavobacterium sp. Sd200]MXN92617.1 prolyl oligopeptidase family serine peptidase [Flavobacterium sp. Sd200]
MKRLFILISALPLLAFAQNYPVTKKTPQTITRHGITFTDDYTWLENMRSPETENWVHAQNDLTDKHLGGLMSKIYPLPTLVKYDNQTDFNIPNKNRKYFYSLVRYTDDALQTASLAYKKKLDGAFIALVNPNFFYSGKTVNIIDYEPSVNSKTLAYKLMINGSDQHEIRFVTVDGGKKLPEVIKNAKFGGMAWKADEGVFYNKNINTSQFAVDSTFQVYYHKVGTDVTTDKMVFDASDAKGQTHYFTSADGTRLFLTVANKRESEVDVYYADLTKDNFELKKFIDKSPPDFDLSGYTNGRIYYSSKESNWGDVRSFDPDSPAEKKVVIPQYQNQLLIHAYFFENRILCKYKNLDGSYLMLFDYNGKFIKKIQTPKAMDIDVAGSDYYDKDIFFYLSSYTIPPILFTLNLETGANDRFVSKTFTKTTAPFPVDYFESKSTTYTSRDGVQVPITIVYKKGTVLNGNNPTLLEAYGGFGVVNLPGYDNGLIYFLNNGGVYAYAEVRGGGDKGRDWHRQGRRLKKINTLNDFIDAAQYLIAQGYTSPARLAITGGSQGGLLVGSALVQHPELFKVAIPKVGVYDMAKFHDYTIGRFHFDEYGNPEDAKEFAAMMEYSPYHNIKDNVNYPTTLIITSDNDDRVPPVHSFKFAAKLQNRAAQTNPVYLKTRSNSGHYGVTTNREDKLKEESDFYAFLLYHINR